MDILKISVLGAAGVLLGILLKDRAPEYVSLVTMGIGLVILGLAVGKISYLFQSLERLKQSLPIDGSYITTLLKMIGITYIGQFSSGICRDAGYSSTGAQIELFCRLSVMVLSMPVLLALLDTIRDFLHEKILVRDLCSPVSGCSYKLFWRCDRLCFFGGTTDHRSDGAYRPAVHGR